MSSENLKKTFETIFKTSDKIDSICSDIYRNIEQTNMDVVKVFEPYIQPKKNLDQLYNFYTSFLRAQETILQTNKQIHEIYGEEIKITDLSSIQKDNLLEILKTMKQEENALEEYSGIKIVDSLLEKSRVIGNNVIEKIMSIYFENLMIKDTNESEMKIISLFLLEYTDQKLFLARYSNAVLDKMTYEDVGVDRKRLLERTKNIENDFKNVNKYNERILGYVDAQNINRGLNKLLIISLKKVIADILLIVEKEESLSAVPFCMELNSRLRQSNEAEIKEIEEVYVYKNEINKIVCNIFLAFIEHTKRLSHPNKFCDIETIVLDLRRALESLEDNKHVTTIFIKNFGAFFKVETIEDICQNFSQTILKKVFELSNQLDSVKRAIYLINNFYTLSNFVDEVEHQNTKQVIEENSEIIVRSWKDELSSKSGRRFSDFIDVNIQSFKSYYLPNEIRTSVVPRIKATIWENILTKGYDDNENLLNDNINEMFTVMGNEDEITEEEYQLIKKQRLKQGRLQRKDKGDLKTPGKYLGPWAGYSGLTYERTRKEKLNKFTKIVNKHCLRDNKELTRNHSSTPLPKNLSIRRFNPDDSYQESRIYKEHCDEVTQLKFLSIYSAFLSASLDGKVHLFSFGELDGLHKTFIGHAKGVSYVDTLRSDTLLCTGSYDGTFKVWNLTTSGKFLYKYNVNDEVLCGTHGSGDSFYLGCANGNISRVDLRSRNNVEDIYNVNGDDFLEYGVKNMTLMNESFLVLNCYDGDIKVIDLRNTKGSMSTIKTKCEKMINIDDRILLVDETNVLNEFDYKSNKITEVMKFDNKISSNVIALGTKLFYTTVNNTLNYSDFTGKVEAQICSVDQNTTCLNVNIPQCSYVVTGNKNGQIRLYKSLKIDDTTD